jgi:APA family basic amino acid/polyamine antiporter
MTKQDNLDDVRRRAAERDGPQTLQRTLTSWQLMTLGVGAIIGAGIFVATGTVAANHAGPAVVLSFLLAASACLCAGLCYAEFAAMMPLSGSAYSYVYATFGRTTAWVIGWCLILEYLMAAATVAVSWSGYLVGLLSSLGITVSPQLSSPPFSLSTTRVLGATGAVLNVPAIVLLGSVTLLLIAGVRLSIRTTSLLVAIKLTVIALFIVCGAFFVEPRHWQPFLPPNTGQFGEFGWSGVVRGAAVVFYADLGFDTVSTAARETRNPQRSMPIGIVGSLLFCTAVYIAFSLVLTGLAPYSALAAPNPVSVALDYAGPPLHFLKIAVEVGVVVGLTSVVIALLYGQSRILYGMSQDGLVPRAFCKIRSRSNTPYASVLACGILAAAAAGLFPVEVLGELISIGTLCAFVFVCAAVLFLRVTRPELERPFRTPFAPLVCVAGVLICGYLMVGLPAATWLRFLAWLAIGMGIYLAYGRRRSAQAARAPEDESRFGKPAAQD